MTRETARRGWPLLLPLAYLLHLAEEWWGGPGFAAWTLSALGREVSPTRFLLLNGVVWPVFAVMTAIASRRPSQAWFLTTFGTIVVVNAILHGLGSLASRSYSPGLLTGLFLYVPLGGHAVAAGARELAAPRFTLAVIGGLLAHALVAVVAFA